MPTFTLPGFVYRQRSALSSPEYAVCVTTVRELFSWAAIRRRSENSEGHQRRLSKAKINAIRRFLQQDERNTIAPSLTVALRHGSAITTDLVIPQVVLPPTVKLSNITVTVPENATDRDMPGVIIDGQHRALGLNEFNPDSIIPIVVLLNVDDQESAFQFVVINNKATRVSTDLIRTLALDYQEQDLQQRLQKARVTLDGRLRLVGIIDVDEESPFRGQITFEVQDPPDPMRIIQPAAIESALALVHDEDIPELKNEDAQLAFFLAIWKAVRAKWERLWTADSKLLHKVSIVAVTQFMTDALSHKYDYADLDITDPEAVTLQVDEILANQCEAFWTCEWKVKINDSKAVRDTIIESLVRIGRNIRSGLEWSEGIDMIIH